MAFSAFKNPFERLSAENQEQMKTSMMEISEYLVDAGRNTIVQGLNVIATKIDILIKNTETISKFLGSGKVEKDKQIDEKKLKAIGVTSKLMGEGMKIIVDAMRVFSKIPDKVIDRFILAIEKIADAFKKLEGMTNVMMNAGRILAKLALGIIYFGLALIVALPIYLMAIPGAIVATTIILGFIFLFSKVLGDKDNANKIYTGAKALALIGIAIILFGIAMLVAGTVIYMKLFNIATIVMMGIIIGFVLLFAWGLGKVFKEGIYDGIKALAFMGIAIILFGLALLVAIPLYQYIFKQEGALQGLGLIGLVILGAVLVFFMLSAIKGSILDGAKALVIMGFAIIVLGLALWIFNKFISDIPNPWETMAQVGVALLGLALVLVIVGTIKTNVISGALALILATVTIIVLSIAMKMWKNARIKWEDLAMVGAAITGLGLVMAAAGIPIVAGFIALGSAVMILAGAALALIVHGLAKFKKIGWKKNDGDMLIDAFSSLTSAMLGGEMPGGFFAAIKFAAAAAARALLIFVTAPAFIFAGFALQSIGKGLKSFKNAGFGPSDGERMESVFASIIKAFTLITDDERKKKYGIKASWLDVYIGTIALQGVGKIMTEIAMGVKAMANLNFIEYEVKRDKDGNTKIQPKGIRKLTDQEIQMAGVNFARIIDVIMAPMVKIGKAEKDSSGWFSGGYFSSGVRALTGTGKIMKDLALGVRSMANLKFVEYEIYTDKDGRKSIQPKEIVAMTDNQMVKAGVSFGKIISAIFLPIVSVGKAEKDSSGWFSNGYFKTGVQSLTGVGKIMKSMASGIQKLAKGEFVTMEIFRDPKTGKTKIQPGEIVKLTDSHLSAAGIMFGKIVEAVYKPIIDVGRAEVESSGLFSDGYFKTGVQSLTGVGKIMGSLTKGIMRLARGEIVTYEVRKDPKTGIAKLQPSAVVKMTPAMLNAAGEQFGFIVNAIFDPIITAGKKFDENAWAMESLFDNVGNFNSLTKGIVSFAKGFSGIQNASALGTNIESFIKAIMGQFGNNGSFNKKSMNRFNIFSKSINFLIMNQSQFEKVADSFEKMADSMGRMKDNINALELDRLKEVVKLFGFMDSLGKSDKTEDLVSKIGDVLKEGIENLQEILEKIAGTGVGSSGAGTGTIATTTNPTAAPQDKTKSKTEQQKPQDLTPLLKELQTINTTLRSGISVRPTTDLFND